MSLYYRNVLVTLGFKLQVLGPENYWEIVGEKVMFNL